MKCTICNKREARYEAFLIGEDNHKRVILWGYLCWVCFIKHIIHRVKNRNPTFNAFGRVKEINE